MGAKAKRETPPPAGLLSDIIEALAWMADLNPRQLKPKDRLQRDLRLTKVQLEALAPKFNAIAETHRHRNHTGEREGRLAMERSHSA